MPIKVLVADDEPDILRLIEIKLRMSGFEVVTARDGAEAVTCALAERPEVVLLDVMMPRLDGYASARRIKAELSPPPVILMLTAKGREADVAQGISQDADDYIVKPFSLRDLIARINVALIRAGKPANAAADA